MNENFKNKKCVVVVVFPDGKIPFNKVKFFVVLMNLSSEKVIFLNYIF